MVDEESTARMLRAAAERAYAYPFKVWGFGEDICLRALLEYGRATGDPHPVEFVTGLVQPWCEARVAPRHERDASGNQGAPRRQPRLTNADHVAPGLVILELFEASGDRLYLDAALALGDLYRSFPEVAGVRVHRRDLASQPGAPALAGTLGPAGTPGPADPRGLGDLIWVDCLALDGPFLARLARVTADASWLGLAIDTTLAYADALLDRRADLFRHGYDTSTRSQSDCCWARGNGWAMHGLLDTILELPDSQPERDTLGALLERQVRAVMRLQSPSGHWHTVLDDPSTPLENSAAAFLASAVLKARRHGLLASLPSEELEASVEGAVAALSAAVSDGGLPISYATPVGSRETYANAPLGIFPWGQGPLLLTLLETQLAARSRTGGNRP